MAFHPALRDVRQELILGSRVSGSVRQQGGDASPLPSLRVSQLVLLSFLHFACYCEYPDSGPPKLKIENTSYKSREGDRGLIKEE